MTTRICGAILLLITCAATAGAQEIVALKRSIAALADPTQDTMDLIGEVQDNLWKEVLLADKREDVARILAFSRGDIQTGASSGASGSTSAVISPLLPAIFGAAFENGAITRTVSGTTISFKANPAGLVCAGMADAVTAVALREREACNTIWRRLGVVASFDTSRGAKKTELADLDTLNSQFSELTVRYEVVNRREASLARFEAERDAFLKAVEKLEVQLKAIETAIAPQSASLQQRLVALVGTPEWKTGTNDLRRRLIEDVVRKAVSEAVLPPELRAAARAVWLDTLQEHQRIETAIAGALVVTADYAWQRPDLATADIAGGIVPKGTRPPDLHTFRVVFAKAPLPNLDVTGNVSFALFGDTRPGMPDAFRDVRAGVEGRFKLRSLNGYGRPTLSFAGLYTYLHQSPLGLGIPTFNGKSLGEKGHIAVFQTKFELPAANNGVRIPISFTVSNRTELITESDVRGQIGVSFNLDSLFVTK